MVRSVSRTQRKSWGDCRVQWPRLLCLRAPGYLLGGQLESRSRACGSADRRGISSNNAHPDILTAYEEALQALTGAGAVIVDVELPLMRLSEPAGWMISVRRRCSPCTREHLEGIDDRDEMGAGLLARGPFVTARDYLKAMRFRSLLQKSIGHTFDDIDVLATPGTTTVAPLLEDMLVDVGSERVDWLSVATRTSLPFDLSGQPAMCIPVARRRAARQSPADRDAPRRGFRFSGGELRSSGRPTITWLGLRCRRWRTPGAPAMAHDLPTMMLAAAGLDIPPDELTELCALYPRTSAPASTDSTPLPSPSPTPTSSRL